MRRWTPALAATLALLPWSPARAAEPPAGGAPNAPNAPNAPAPSVEKRVPAAPEAEKRAPTPAPAGAPAAGKRAPVELVEQPPAAEAPPTATVPPGDAPSPAGAEAAPSAPSAEAAEQPEGTAAPTPAPERRPRRAAPPPEEAPEEEIPPASDTVGGHLAVAAHGGLFFPFGAFAEGRAQSDALGSGYAIGGDVTYGVSRTLVLGISAQVGLPEAEGALSGSDVSTLAVGPLVRYHLVQGTRFDPWMAFGIGFRSTKAGNESLTGLDWARLQLGGDWYATSGLGFGPLLELSLGTFFDSSEGKIETKSVNAHFLLGARIVFDSPGK